MVIKKICHLHFGAFHSIKTSKKMLYKNNVLFLLAFSYVCSKSESMQSEKDQHYGYHKHWWNKYQFSHNHHGQDESEFFHGAIGPYRLLGKPPLIATRPYGCKAIELYMVLR